MIFLSINTSKSFHNSCCFFFISFLFKLTSCHFYIDNCMDMIYTQIDTASFCKQGEHYMPKVTEEYLKEKRKYILECTGEILKEKPLYTVTMRDIIKKAGFSQGIIYHYYASLDDIYVDYINSITACPLLEQNIDTLLHSELTEKEIVSECIIAIGRYIEELLTSVGGRTCFELTVFYAYDIEKRAALFPKLKFKQSLGYAQNRVLEYVLNNIEKGIFHPQIPIRSIVMFINSFIDGIAQSAATGTAEGPDGSGDISNMFMTLAKAVTGFLSDVK